MTDPTNPMIISSAALKPNGNLKVVAIYEIRLQPSHLPDLSSLPNKVICKLTNDGLGAFELEGTPYPVDTQQQEGDYRIYHLHARFKPAHSLTRDPKVTDPGILGVEDFTFSIVYNLGSSSPPPPNNLPVDKRLPVIEIDPCSALTP